MPWKAGAQQSDIEGGLGARVRPADSGGLQAELEEEIRAYGGYVLRLDNSFICLTMRSFTATTSQRTTLARRGLPRAIVALLESLLHVSPRARPTCERVLSAVRDAAVRIILAYPRGIVSDYLPGGTRLSRAGAKHGHSRRCPEDGPYYTVTASTASTIPIHK